MVFIHHPSVCVYFVQKEPGQRCSSAFISRNTENLSIIEQISLRTLVNTLLVLVSRIYQRSLNTAGQLILTHAHTDARRHCTAGLCGHTCAFCSLQRSSWTRSKHILSQLPPPPTVPLLYSVFTCSAPAFTSRVIANLHQLDSLVPQTQKPRGGLSTILPFRVKSELKAWTAFGSE